MILDDINHTARLKLLGKFGTLINASRQTSISYPVLSLALHGHRPLTKKQRQKLLKYFSDGQVRRMFPSKRKVEVEAVTNSE